MLAFRSEAHLARWLELQCVAKGAVFTPQQMWRLAHAWYADRLDPDWRRRSPAEVEALFGEVGLTGEFWRLTPP